MATPQAISVDGGDNAFEVHSGLPGAVVEKMDKVPGGTTMVQFVTMKINNMVNLAAADPEFAKVVNATLAEIAIDQTHLRQCFHGDAYDGGEGEATWGLSSYFTDEGDGGHQKTALSKALLAIAKTGIEKVDAGPAVYDDIKGMWESIPSIPFVFEKPEVEFPTVEQTVADGLKAALEDFMGKYEHMQRAGKAKMGDAEKNVFLANEKSGELAYAIQYPADGELYPAEPKFDAKEAGISLTG